MSAHKFGLKKSSYVILSSRSTPMGWFTSNAKPEESTVSTRQDRIKCWEKRDAYFSCLDRSGVVKAGEEGGACSSEYKKYEENCAKSWVR